MEDTYCVLIIARKQIIGSACKLTKQEAKDKKKLLQSMIEQYQIKAKVKMEVER